MLRLSRKTKLPNVLRSVSQSAQGLPAKMQATFS